MQRFLFQLFWLVSVLMSEQEVLQNQPVLKLLLLLYAANNNRHLWITRAVHNKYRKRPIRGCIEISGCCM